jgi:Enoyl-CoA hydratase/isomerase
VGGNASTQEMSFGGKVVRLQERQRTLTGALVAVRKPTIAALPGPAAGAGLAIALACDIRIASEPTIITTGYAKIGLTGDYDISWLLTRLAGTARARELMYLSEPSTPAAAKRWASSTASCPMLICKPRPSRSRERSPRPQWRLCGDQGQSGPRAVGRFPDLARSRSRKQGRRGRLRAAQGGSAGLHRKMPREFCEGSIEPDEIKLSQFDPSVNAGPIPRCCNVRDFGTSR